MKIKKSQRGTSKDADGCGGQSFSQRLLVWYDCHRRVMPWRAQEGEAPNPYYVWLSEMMLQQTTVATVRPYFIRFIQQWPTVQALAKAQKEDVLSAWAGLGYYRRAHYLHAAAQQIVVDFDGVFPRAESELKELSGIGAYTAAAIAAIAFGQRANVVDGNVERIMARQFRVDEVMPHAKPILAQRAETCLPKDRYGDYAQALMDLGATVCRPRRPQCEICPVSGYCLAYQHGDADAFPRAKAKMEKEIRHTVAFVALDKQGALFIRRRAEKGLLSGMMEVPSSDWLPRPISLPTAIQECQPFRGNWHLCEGMVTHIFSHFILKAHVCVARFSSQDKPIVNMPDARWIPVHQREHVGLPSVMQKIVCHAHIHYDKTIKGHKGER